MNIDVWKIPTPSEGVKKFQSTPAVWIFVEGDVCGRPAPQRGCIYKAASNVKKKVGVVGIHFD